MELRRNEKLNGIELHVTAAEKKNGNTVLQIANLGWHYSQRKGHYWSQYDEALIAATKAAFPALDKSSKGKGKKPEAGAQKPKTDSKKQPPKKTDSKKQPPKKADTKKETVKVSPDVIPFSIEKAGFKADPSIGVTDLKVWKAAVLHSVEEILDSAIAALAQ